jgi:hypothetical protein
MALFSIDLYCGVFVLLHFLSKSDLFSEGLLKSKHQIHSCSRQLLIIAHWCNKLIHVYVIIGVQFNGAWLVSVIFSVV